MGVPVVEGTLGRPAPHSTGEAGDAPPAIVRGGFARLGLAALGATALALVVSAVVQLVIDSLPLTYPSNAPAALLTAVSVVIVAGVVVALAHRRWWRGSEVTAVVALAALATAVLALPLHGTPLYLGGSIVDQSFRMQYLVRLTDSWHLADMNYADLPPYYPAGWFWLSGRFADLAGIPGWRAFKPAGIATSALVPCVSLVVWSRLVGRRTGVLIGLATVAVGLYPAQAGAFVDEPYSWLFVTLVPAVAVIAWRALVVADRAPLHAAVTMGVMLGVGALTYTLYAGFAALLVTCTCAFGVLRARRAGAPPGAQLSRLTALGITGAVSAALAALAWAPYVWRVLRDGAGEAAALHYLPPISAQLPTPMLTASPFGALLLLGCGWLLLRCRAVDTAAALLGVVALGYTWYLMSTAALLAGTTLLAFRLEAVLVQTMAVAGCLAAVACWKTAPRVRADLPVAWRAGRRPVTVLAAVAGAAVLVSSMQAVPYSLGPQLEAAYNNYTGDGVTAAGARDETDDGAWTPQLVAAIEQVGARPVDQIVALCAPYGLGSFTPVRLFQQSTPHYANPLADHPARNAEIGAWAAAGTPDELERLLAASPFRPPDVFVLRRADAGFQITLASDVFPADPNVTTTVVTFSPSLFPVDRYSRVDVGPFVVLGRS